MTACVNKKSKRVAAVVTASLVGALSIGAPAVALAANANIDMLATDVATAIKRGTVSEYKIGGVYKKGNDKVTISASTSSKTPIQITKVTPDGVNVDDVDVSSADNYQTKYFKKATKAEIQAGTGIATINGVKYVTADPSVPGEYIAVLRCGKPDDPNADFVGKEQSAPVLEFTVVADSLEGSYLAKLDRNSQPTVTDFAFDGKTKWSDLKLMKSDDTEFKSGATWDVFTKNDDKTSVKNSRMDAGTYVVVIKGTDTYAGQSLKLEVSVSKLDLSKADLYIADVTDGVAPTFDSILGDDKIAVTEAGNKKGYDFKIQGATWGAEGAGTYTYTLSVNDTEFGKAIAANVEGTATLKFHRLNANASAVVWDYNNQGVDFATSAPDIVIDRSVDEDTYGSSPWTLKSLDFSKFTGTYKDAENKDAKLTADQFSWTIVDNKTGETVSDLSKKGEYTVVLEADPAKLGYDVNRTRSTFQVTVKQGTIGTADTTFSYNGNVVTALDNLTYDGEDFLSAVNVQVKDDKGNLLKAGQDYVVKAYNSKGKEVKEIVDADNYTIVVTSDSYAFANGKDKEVLNVTVGKINLSKVSFDRAKAPFKTFYSGVDASGKPVVKHSGIPYTGSVIENPVVTFKANDRNGEEKTFVLPSDIYTINWTLGTKRVDALKDAGTYTAQVVLGDKASNYTASGNLTITGTEVKKDMETGFVDVKDEEWFAEALNKAKVNGYLSGRGETGMVAPTENITRADAVVVLYKMAGGSLKSDEYEYDANKYYETGFSDVDGRAYYANAIAWAQDMDIANGSNGKFRPEDKVTREEFAALLSNYAIAKGDYVAASDDALAGMPDASTVSPWFTDAVSWAVENGIMGNGGKISAQSNIQRAEVAAMAVNYQPGFFA